MIKTNSRIANQFLNDLGNFKNDIKPFKDVSIKEVNDEAVILKNENTGMTSSYSKAKLEEAITFRLDFGIFNEQEMTKDNAQTKFTELFTLLV